MTYDYTTRLDAALTAAERLAARLVAALAPAPPPGTGRATPLPPLHVCRAAGNESRCAVTAAAPLDAGDAIAVVVYNPLPRPVSEVKFINAYACGGRR